MMEIVVATNEAYDLGEGPLWDPIRSQLLWVDIPNGTVLVGTLHRDGEISVLDKVRVEGSSSAIVVSERGEWAIAGARRLIVVDTGGRVLPLTPLVKGVRRLNDGKPDPAGRLVVGTLSLEDISSESEQLIQIDFDGRARVIDADLTQSNGLAWTPDGTVLYSIDTLRRVVFRRQYDVSTGRTGERQIFLSFDQGLPDGMTIDVEGHLWIAMWGLGQVRRYSPEGHLVQTISVPAPHTSSVCFAGTELDTLVITTATQGLSADQLEEFPLSGRLFTVAPGIRGFPQPLWSGTSYPGFIK
ncbi:MAG: SMP-30/gluconolactonase/LRE family protein [Humibacter sp.]